jgi:predicted NAD/FAD-binding protein
VEADGTVTPNDISAGVGTFGLDDGLRSTAGWSETAPSLHGAGKRIAVIGSGISGLSAAWLLSRRHRVTLYESDSRPGGHSNTVTIPACAEAMEPVPVDTGFIVFNEDTYPNLTALFRHLEVPTIASEMSLAVSMDGGAFEYSGATLDGLLARRSNLLRPRFWSMLRDLARFYREAPEQALRPEWAVRSLAEYLAHGGYGKAFVADHLLPMCAAIWSAPPREMLDYPFQSFARFCANHGLLKFRGRPVWRTVAGGSTRYVRALLADAKLDLRLNSDIVAVDGDPLGLAPELIDSDGVRHPYDAVVLACHADQALRLLARPSPLQSWLLGAFRYQANRAILHGDPRLMPVSRRAWACWNVIETRDQTRPVTVSYWMNRLQRLALDRDVFVTLNPAADPRAESIHAAFEYTHPLFDGRAVAAQSQLWRLQGASGLWFCGAYFGAGFHEDGLQAGLAVAEALGGVRRPWQVPDESGRIRILPAPLHVPVAG